MNKEEFEGRNFFVGKIEEIKIDVFETVTKINQYVKELERLAKIGKAVEKVFEEWSHLGSSCYVDEDMVAINHIVFNNTQELLEWAEKED